MRRNTAALILALLSVIWPSVLFAQSSRFFSTEDGLSSSLINQIYQDKLGYVWIATENGLNKYDGNKFQIYKNQSDNPFSLSSNYVRTIFEDSSGNLWIGCINGLMRYDRDADLFYEVPVNRHGRRVYPHVAGIVEMSADELWIATSGQGVFSVRKAEAGFEVAPRLTSRLDSDFLNEIFLDTSGKLWIGSENHGLARYDPSTDQLKKYRAGLGINSDNISAIAEDKNGNIYVGTLTSGLSIYAIGQDRFIEVPTRGGTELFVKSLLVNKDNQLYIGTDGQGYKRLDMQTGVIEAHEIDTAPFSFSRGKIHSILLDRDGNLWFGLFQTGIVFTSSSIKNFGYYGYKSFIDNPIGASAVWAVHTDTAGNLWVGTDNDGLYCIDKDGNRVAHFDSFSKVSNPCPDNILSVLVDSRDRLWVGSYTHGLAQVDKRTGNCSFVSRFVREKVYCLSEDASGNLLVGTYGSGFFIIGREGNVRHFESSKLEHDDYYVDELCNDWINTFMVDRSGMIWVGHYKGLSCYDPVRNTFINYLGRNNVVPNTVVQSVFEDENGIIWIGTTEGLYRFDRTKGTPKKYGEKDGLPDNVICGIKGDKEGNLWVSTYRGLSKYMPEAEKFVNYFASDGIQGNEFSRGAAYSAPDGRLYFGGTDGVTFFRPEAIIDVPRELNIFLTDFYLGNTVVKKGDRSGRHSVFDRPITDVTNIKVAYYDNTFAFDFTTFEFSKREQIHYQYRIDEQSSRWITTPPGTNRITFHNMLPGNYTFRVRAVDGESVSEDKILYIHVFPPWFQTWWAYMIYSILALLFVYGIISYLRSMIKFRREMVEKRHAEEINEAKIQFFMNISHEVRTPMTLIINPLEKLVADTDEPEHHKLYMIMYRNAQRILRLINQMMDIRKLDKGQMEIRCRETDLVGFIKDIMHTFDYQARKKSINFTFEYHREPFMAYIDMNNFDKVVMNILSNAFKFTPDGGHIDVKLSAGSGDNRIPGGEYFELSIQDSGPGIDEEERERIFDRFYQIAGKSANQGTGIGLHLSKLLVELHNGVIYAENRSGTGSRFVVRLPMGCAHLKPEQIIDPTADIENAEPGERQSAMLDASMVIQEEEIRKSYKRAKTRYKVMVVEDDPDIRNYLKDVLSPIYRITVCTNGREAYEAALADQPEIIVSDVQMPEMDGITLCRKIKQNINVNHIPVILLTAHSKSEDKLTGLECGADAYIVKPFNMDELIETINNLIANREILKSRYSGGHKDDKIQKISLRSSDEILMDRIVKYINENLSNPDLNVELLAASVGMSRVHLHRKLKELTGQSARDYIKGIRLRQAAYLLQGKKLSVSEVAYATGFSSLPHFSSSFKDFFGCSPTEYVSRNQSEKENRESITDNPEEIS